MTRHFRKGVLPSIFVAFAALYCLAAPTAQAATSAQIEADPTNTSRVHIVAVPAGTTKLHWAVMKDMSAKEIKWPYPDQTYNPAYPYYTPPAGYSVIDLQARNSNGADLGTWAGRLQLGGSPPPPQTSAAPPSPSGSMKVGLDAGNYGTSGAADVKGAVNLVRYDSELGVNALGNFKAAGLTIQMQFPGPYNSGGVCSINASAWVSKALNFYSSNTNTAQTPTIEVLNEPGGTWFWGSNATSTGNGACYRNLLQQTYTAFHGRYGTSAPKVLASVDGSGGLTFGRNWWTPSAAGYVDGVTVHPYGGTGSRSSSSLGNRARVEEAHALTGEPVYITEVGWPTAVGQPSTGDSLQWTESEQATIITNFIAWARSKGYVAEVVYFDYHDFGGSNLYGVVRGNGTHKPSYEALRKAALE
jgi:hypothetical protein